MAKNREKRNGKGGKEGEEPQRKKRSRGDRIFWPSMLLIAGFIAADRFGSSLGSPWSEILVAFKVLCPIVIVVLLVWAFPHPLRTMNAKLARERESLKKEKKRQARRRGF